MYRIIFYASIYCFLSGTFACQPTKENNSTSDTLQTESNKKEDSANQTQTSQTNETLYAQDLSLDGRYICTNEDGSEEYLSIENNGKKILYNSGKKPDKISLTISNAELDESHFYCTVTFPNAPQQKYVLYFTPYSLSGSCNNPDNSRQIFYKVPASEEESIWQLIFMGYHLESPSYYIDLKKIGDNSGALRNDVNTPNKIAKYLSTYYTGEAIQEVQKSLHLEERGGILYAPMADGGDLSNYEKSTLKLLEITANERTYMLTVPWGAPEDNNKSEHKIKLRKEGNQWKLASPTGLGLGG